jgi:hypothetical protein
MRIRHWGEKRGLTDHPAITATVTLTKERG